MAMSVPMVEPTYTVPTLSETPHPPRPRTTIACSPWSGAERGTWLWVGKGGGRGGKTCRFSIGPWFSIHFARNVICDQPKNATRGTVVTWHHSPFAPPYSRSPRDFPRFSDELLWFSYKMRESPGTWGFGQKSLENRRKRPGFSRGIPAVL